MLLLFRSFDPAFGASKKKDTKQYESKVTIKNDLWPQLCKQQNIDERFLLGNKIFRKNLLSSGVKKKSCNGLAEPLVFARPEEMHNIDNLLDLSASKG